jgi:hypothetical protein
VGSRAVVRPQAERIEPMSSGGGGSVRDVSWRRAYWTPSPDEVPQLVARMLFAGPGDRPTASFQLAVETAEGEAWGLDSPELEFQPIMEVAVGVDCFALLGTQADGTVGVLHVDLGPHPPIARFSSDPVDAKELFGRRHFVDP